MLSNFIPPCATLVIRIDTPLPSNHSPTHRIISSPEVVQRDRDPCDIAPYFGHRILGMTVEVNASVFVGLIAGKRRVVAATFFVGALIG
jgi:hypothetical protein